jgi:hypothetical protein
VVSSLPPKIDGPLNKNPWNNRWMAEVLRHEMLLRVLFYILSQPCDLVLLNCSAGFHRAPCIAALLFAILVASHLNFMSGVCVVLWVGVNLFFFQLLRCGLRHVMWKLSS